LQLRNALSYSQSESEYLTAIKADQAAQNQFSTFMERLRRPESLADQHGQPLTEPASIARYESGMAQLPLIRMIRGLELSYTTAVAAPAASVATSDAVKHGESGVVRAEQAVRRGEWLSALEAWGDLLNHGKPSSDERREALLGRIRALSELNEQHLLEWNLRGMLLHDNDPQIRMAAYGLLLARYGRSNDLEGLLALQATMLHRTGYHG